MQFLIFKEHFPCHYTFTWISDEPFFLLKTDSAILTSFLISNVILNIAEKSDIFHVRSWKFWGLGPWMSYDLYLCHLASTFSAYWFKPKWKRIGRYLWRSSPCFWLGSWTRLLRASFSLLKMSKDGGPSPLWAPVLRLYYSGEEIPGWNPNWKILLWISYAVTAAYCCLSFSLPSERILTWLSLLTNPPLSAK